MKGQIKIAAALAAGCLIGWFSNAQVVRGQGTQAQTPAFGTINHLGFAVNDADKMAKAFAAAFGVQNVPASLDVRDISWGPHFPGKKMNVRRAGMTINGVTFEILQPLEGDSPWKEFIAKSGEGLHHIGFAVPDAAKAKDYLESRGGVQMQQFMRDGKNLANYIDMHKAGLPITFEVVGVGRPAAAAAQ